MSKLKTHTKRRTACPVCESKDLTKPLSPHKNLNYPLLPVCVNTSKETDIFAKYTIIMCNDCGLIMLRDVVSPDVLYQIFHSDGIGKVWDAHYEKFAGLIRKHHKTGRVLEIGAGQGKLVQKLRSHYDSGLEVIDPMYEGPRQGVVVHESLLTPEVAAKMQEQFSSVISSHTLEHFIEYRDLLATAWTCLKTGGLIFTAVPNQEFNFAKGYGNQLNFEHPAACTNAHWLYLHQKHGFVVREIAFFRNHSTYIVAEKIPEPEPYDIDVKELSIQILEEHTKNIYDRIKIVREHAKKDKENWLFGASNYSQPLFLYDLEESYFVGVLDNSPLKHGKRLYGTSLICKKPEEVVGKRKNLRVFVNLGHYNAEVEEQLRSLDPKTEIILI